MKKNDQFGYGMFTYGADVLSGNGCQCEYCK